MEKISLPKLLQEIPDPPKQLYIRGNYPRQDDTIFLTIIGSRKYSSYGKNVCEKIIRGLAGYPFVIISGLAIGIDTIAHQSALEAGLKTVAVVGSGLSPRALYPASNRNLAEQIIRKEGCLLSEYEPEFRATKWSFPQRNRIMAGLCHAVLVIEAENISGTRITARLATEYNREVLSIPGSIFSSSSSGSNKLIAEGAFPITCSEDIINYFNLPGNENVSQIPTSKVEQSLLDLINEPQPTKTLSDKLGLSVREVSILISKLEIKGLLSESMGVVVKKV